MQPLKARAFSAVSVLSESLLFLTALFLLCSFVFCSHFAFASEPQEITLTPTAIQTVAPREFHGDLRFLPQLKLPEPMYLLNEHEEPQLHKTAPRGLLPRPEDMMVPAPLMPASTSFVGIQHDGGFGAGYPPDTVGDVGSNYYIEAVNTSFAVYNKTGTQLAISTFSTLWSGAGTGTPCDSNNAGDPVVLYDTFADRWILSDLGFAVSGGVPISPYYECFAVSKTNDPITGGFWLYAIRADDASHAWLNDYPKFGLWPDALYMSANMFAFPAGTFQEVRNWALNKAQMYAGLPVQIIVVDMNTTAYFALLPSNARVVPPPAGRVNFFVGESTTAFEFNAFKFHVDWATPASSTFTGPTNVTQTGYALSPTRVPSPANNLDTLLDRAMMQNQYRNIGGTESLWIAHTTGRATGTPARGSVQWAQLNVTGATVATTPVQQQIWNNGLSDTLHRWMPSIAVDRAGNMAVGYSAGNNTTPAQLRYAGRLATDALNTMGQGEAIMFSGTGSQNGTCGGVSCTRWGDYSAMSVDPVDDCTFWYTNEYYAVNGMNWQTRIGSFRYTAGQCASRGAGEPAPILLSKSGGNLVISWTAQSANCGTQDYALYKGTIGSPFGYNHAPVTCTTTNLPSVTIPMPADNLAYFVVTSESGFDEGSYGRASTNVERPVGSPACRPLQTIGVCQ